MKILTINSHPDTFTSKLPEGVHGSLELLENISLLNVRDIEISNAGDYEENMDAEYRIYFHNGDEIQWDGYCGLWVLDGYDSLSNKAKEKALRCLREVLEYNIKYADG
jgi:hypothetical protein